MESFVNYFLVSSIGFCIVGVLGRRSNNHGFEGEIGEHKVYGKSL
nr:hypothetical protein F987_00533 [Acinetobacter gyllenbergii NIPH 230]